MNISNALGFAGFHYALSTAYYLSTRHNTLHYKTQTDAESKGTRNSFIMQLQAIDVKPSSIHSKLRFISNETIVMVVIQPKFHTR